MERNHNKHLLRSANDLRKNMTKEERHLWYDFLKLFHRQRDIIFLRQKIIGSYIVDFYCPRAKLVIELDGSQHYEEEAEQYDTERTNYLNRHGIEVLRYTNLDIHRRFEDVCRDIEFHVNQRIAILEE
jgi:very-short-patch-repair endonuclease